MTLEHEVVLTRSGARAMLDKRSGEVMHPIVGPLAEAERLYVAPARLRGRLSEPRSDAVVLFDVGLGAGSNAAAAFHLSEAEPPSSRRLEIVSFDRSLAALELASAPEHAAAFGLSGSAGVAARALLERRAHESARTHWRWVEGDVREALAREPAASADVVFWDPFSPAANPELWTLEAFLALRRVCREGASVHTYSGATAVRSALLLAGFWVGVGEKIGEGKYATVAAASAGVLERPLDRRWLDRLARSSAPFPSDAPKDALGRVRECAQFAPDT